MNDNEKRTSTKFRLPSRAAGQAAVQIHAIMGQREATRRWLMMILPNRFTPGVFALAPWVHKGEKKGWRRSVGAVESPDWSRQSFTCSKYKNTNTFLTAEAASQQTSCRVFTEHLNSFVGVFKCPNVAQTEPRLKPRQTFVEMLQDVRI